MTNPYLVEPANPLAALQYGVQGFDRARASAKEAELQNARREASRIIQSGGDVTGALAQLLGIGDASGASALATFGNQSWTRQFRQREAQRAQSNADRSYGLQKRQLAITQQGAGGVYGTPIYGVDPETGQTVLGAMDKQGGFRRVDTGGVVPTPGVRFLDTGTGYVPTDTRTGRAVAEPVTKDVAGAAREKKVGEAAGAATVSMPDVLAKGQQTLDLITQIRNHPGKDYSIGAMGVLPPVPGTPQADFLALLDQAKGRAFLEAYQSLKGGGAISEPEGRKATEAIARLQRTQSKAGFNRALFDLEGVVRSAMKRARNGAVAAPAAAEPAPATAPLTSGTTNGVPWRIKAE